MWHKYLNRTCDQLRLFRYANLKFNQDDMGMTRHKTLSTFKDLVFRMARSEGNLRGFGFFAFLGTLSSLLYIKSRFYDPIYTAPKIAEAKQR